MEGEKRDKHMMEIQRTGSLPHDLIIEILSRVPPKPLSRFRCVSKQWYHLLTHDHEFIARHSKWSNKNPLLLIRRYISDENWETSKTKATVELTSVNLDGNVTDKFKIIIDGLIQTFISCGPLSLICCNYSLYLCNPSFHELVRVPYRSRICLQNVGIGYVPSSSDYKIVHLFETPRLGDRNMVSEVLTFRHTGKISLGPWRGCTETSTMDVWLLDKDEKSWAIEHRISLFPFAMNFLISSDNGSEEILIHTEQKGLNKIQREESDLEKDQVL
ncbi:UNVERIFIED_CONTAM: F-box protein [Sesamum latifolium]|uniref:F-box protein n=1 Tax=Sesamum latifolium TaxID=2727402 RepID=A0AAW2TZ26_9LAMI